MKQLHDYELQKLGFHKNAPRLYKQGKRLAMAGFDCGMQYRVEIHQERGLVALCLDSRGDHVVSRKEVATPVIDLNSRQVLDMFDGMDMVRVVIRHGEIFIMAVATEVRRKERLDRLQATLAAGEPLPAGSLSHGAGILSHAIHSGLKAAGVPVRLAFANEIEPEYLAQAQAANEIWDNQTIAICAPMQHFSFDHWAMQNLPPVLLLEAGLPCTATSTAGRAKKGLAKPEDDPQVGHLIVSFLNVISRCNPAVVILENVPLYQDTASMAIYRSTMTDLGYEVHERILEGRQFGCLENRKRMAAVAVTRGMQFDFDAIQAEMEESTKSVADILEPIPADDPVWSPMQYLKDKEVRDAANGKCFARQEVHPEDTSIPTITRGYMKRRSTDPMLVNPDNPDLLRLFTPKEHAAAKGVPFELLREMTSFTRMHEMLGQGICYPPFFALGKVLGRCLKLPLCQIHPLVPSVTIAQPAQQTLLLAA